MLCPLSCSWVFIHEKAYQVFDTGIESSVMTKVKGFGYHQGRVMDVADYVFPQQVCDPVNIQVNAHTDISIWCNQSSSIVKWFNIVRGTLSDSHTHKLFKVE